MLAAAEGGETVVSPLVRRKRGRPRTVRVDATPKILVDLRPAPLPPPSAVVVEVQGQSSQPTDSDSDSEGMSAKRRRSEEHDSDGRHSSSSSSSSSSLAVSGVLALLLDEVRDMQRSVKTMEHSVAKLATNQDSLDSMQHSLKRQLDSLGTVTAGRSPPELLTVPPFGRRRRHLPHHHQALPSLRDHIALSDGLSRTRFGSLFPFLSSYDLDSMPFVIDDLCKPIVLLRVIDPRLMFRPMPVMVYGNQAFCDLTQYHPHEIQGFMVMKVFLASPANINLISQHVQSNRSVLGVGQILHMLSTRRTKDGTLYTAHMRNQPFFDSNAKEAWGLTVIDKVEPVAPADVAAVQPAVNVCASPAAGVTITHASMHQPRHLTSEPTRVAFMPQGGPSSSLSQPPSAGDWTGSGRSSSITPTPSPETTPALPPPSPFSSFSLPVPMTWSQWYT